MELYSHQGQPISPLPETCHRWFTCPYRLFYGCLFMPGPRRLSKLISTAHVLIRRLQVITLQPLKPQSPPLCDHYVVIPASPSDRKRPSCSAMNPELFIEPRLSLTRHGFTDMKRTLTTSALQLLLRCFRHNDLARYLIVYPFLYRLSTYALSDQRERSTCTIAVICPRAPGIEY